jgi:hypothetical protein
MREPCPIFLSFADYNIPQDGKQLRDGTMRMIAETQRLLDKFMPRNSV